MPTLKFFRYSNNQVGVELAGIQWMLQHDLQNGGFCLVMPELQFYDLEPLTAEDYAANVGMEHSGYLSSIVREYTVEELSAALPAIAKLFDLPVPQHGRFVLSTVGEPFWVGSLVKSEWGPEYFDHVLVLRLWDQAINVRMTGAHKDDVVETTMPVVRLSTHGQAVCPIVPVMAQLIKWADIIEILAKRRGTMPGHNWQYQVHFAADGTTIHGEWHKNRRH
jgi:hypothetical protein